MHLHCNRLYPDFPLKHPEQSVRLAAAMSRWFLQDRKMKSCFPLAAYMNSRKAEWLMASVALAWGSSYLLMKLGLDGIGPYNLIALRFGVAFFVMSVLFFPRYRLLTVSRWQRDRDGNHPLSDLLRYGQWCEPHHGIDSRLFDEYDGRDGTGSGMPAQEDASIENHCDRYAACSCRTVSADGKRWHFP